MQRTPDEERRASENSEQEPFHALVHELEGVTALAREYVRAHLARMSASVHTLLLKAVFFALLGIFAAAAAFTAGALVILGIADTLAAVAPIDLWAARLITGGSIIVVSVLGLGVVLRRKEKAWLKQRKDEYRKILDGLH